MRPAQREASRGAGWRQWRWVGEEYVLLLFAVTRCFSPPALIRGKKPTGCAMPGTCSTAGAQMQIKGWKSKRCPSPAWGSRALVAPDVLRHVDDLRSRGWQQRDRVSLPLPPSPDAAFCPENDFLQQRLPYFLPNASAAGPSGWKEARPT